MINKFVTWILDFLFPLSCISCKKSGILICDNCLNGIHGLEMQECPVCRKLNSFGEKCTSCFSSLDGLIVACRYDKKGLLKKLIEAFKYKYSRELSNSLSAILLTKAPLLFNFFDRSVDDGSSEIILIPVPLHKKRFNERGYNQSQILCENLAGINRLKLYKSPILARKINTLPQAKLKRIERLINVKNAFECVNPSAIYGKNIALVDDVCTTSATLSECAIELKKNGALKVCGLVLARGDFH